MTTPVPTQTPASRLQVAVLAVVVGYLPMIAVAAILRFAPSGATAPPAPLGWVRDAGDVLGQLPLTALMVLALISMGVSRRELGIGWRTLPISVVAGGAICLADFWFSGQILRQHFAPVAALVLAGERAISLWPLDIAAATLDNVARPLNEELLRVAVILGLRSSSGRLWPGVLASGALYLLVHIYLAPRELLVIVPSAVMYSLYSLRRVDLPALLIAHISYDALFVVMNAGLTP